MCGHAGNVGREERESTQKEIREKENQSERMVGKKKFRKEGKTDNEPAHHNREED